MDGFLAVEHSVWVVMSLGTDASWEGNTGYLAGGDHRRGPTTVPGIPIRVASEVHSLEGSTLSVSGVRWTPGSHDLLFDSSAYWWQ